MSNQSYNDQGQLDVLLQRHFLQTGFADLELQELWRRLKSQGMWDDSLIVVAADHGVAFLKGRRDRRTLDSQNYGEIAPIPLFIKAPGQKKGKVNDAYVETIDILPTIFDLLHLKPKVKMDGHSAFSPEVQKRRLAPDPPAQHVQAAPLLGPGFEAAKKRVRERNLRALRHGRGRAPGASTGSAPTRSFSAGACRWAGDAARWRSRARPTTRTWIRARTSCPPIRWAGSAAERRGGTSPWR